MKTFLSVVGAIALGLFLVGSCGPSSPSSYPPSSGYSYYPSPTTDAAPAGDPLVSGTYPAGTYEVGTEIKPGRYTTPGSDFCYWERDKANSGELSDIIANENVTGQGSMTVKTSDKYVKFDGTCTWTKR